MHKNTNKHLKNTVYTGLFSAFVAVATMIAVPSGIGYVNSGDIAVILGAFILSPAQATIAAGLGSALADLINGYAIYVPATFVIKACMALCAHFIKKWLVRMHTKDVIAATVAAVCAELVMAFGYISYEWTVMGYGAAALAGVWGNFVQGGFGIVGGVALYFILGKVFSKTNYFNSDT